jgi:hypothetical protein
VHPVGPASTSELERLTLAHCHSDKYDALCIFLLCHLCICRRIEREQKSLALVRLNGIFVKQCVAVYESFTALRLDPAHLSDKWIDALDAYKRRPKSPISVLPLMAKAHIDDDLPKALFHSDVNKEDFDAVEPIIMNCLHEVLNEVSRGGALEVKFIASMQWLWNPFGRSTHFVG